MSITDELRKWWVRKFPVMDKELHEDFAAIADRIDAAHERTVMSAMNDALYHANDESMAELGWVRLPLGADGVPIHAGDTLDGYGKTIEVVEMRYGRGGWVLISRDGNGYADTFAFAHHHEPTVEDVLQEMLVQAVGYSDAHTTVALNTISEYAAKLRLAESEDE